MTSLIHVDAHKLGRDGPEVIGNLSRVRDRLIKMIRYHVNTESLKNPEALIRKVCNIPADYPLSLAKCAPTNRSAPFFCYHLQSEYFELELARRPLSAESVGHGNSHDIVFSSLYRILQLRMSIENT